VILDGRKITFWTNIFVLLKCKDSCWTDQYLDVEVGLPNRGSHKDRPRPSNLKKNSKRAAVARLSIIAKAVIQVEVLCRKLTKVKFAV